MGVNTEEKEGGGGGSTQNQVKQAKKELNQSATN